MRAIADTSTPSAAAIQRYDSIVFERWAHRSICTSGWSDYQLAANPAGCSRITQHSKGTASRCLLCWPAVTYLGSALKRATPTAA